MVNFKKDKNGKYHFTASLGFDKRTGLREIRPIDIQKWQNNLLSKYKNSYVRNMYGIFQMSFTATKPVPFTADSG